MTGFWVGLGIAVVLYGWLWLVGLYPAWRNRHNL